MPTKNKQIMVMVTPELEEKIYELRKTDEFIRCTLSELIRTLLEEALDYRENTIFLDLRPENMEKLKEFRENHGIETPSAEETLYDALLKGLEMEGYLKDTKGA